jgi:hypothetical protein
MGPRRIKKIKNKKKQLKERKLYHVLLTNVD